MFANIQEVKNFVREACTTGKSGREKITGANRANSELSLYLGKIADAVQESHYELLGQLWGEMTAPLQDGKGDVIIASGNFQQALDDGSTNQHPLVQSAIGNMTGAVRILDGEDGSASAVNSLLQPENAEAITELAAHLRAAGEIAIRLAGITTGAEDEVEQAQLQIYEGVSAADKYIETVL